MKRLALLLALLAWPVTVDAQLLNAQRLRLLPSAVTIADNGGGTAATATLTTAEVSYIPVTCNDTNGGCTVSLSEAGAREGQQLVISFVASNASTIADSSGVVELSGGQSFVSTQYDTLTLVYLTDRWVEKSRSNAALKLYDAEASGNTLTLPFTEYIPGAVCESDYAAASYAYIPDWRSVFASAPTPVCIAGANVTTAAAQFVDASTRILWNERRLPADWTGAIDLMVFWRTSAITGNAVWQFQTACVADSEVVDPAWNAAQTVTDAALGTTFWRNSTSSTSLTTTGCAAGETFYFKLFRDPTHASDTLGAIAELLGVQLTIRRGI